MTQTLSMMDRDDLLARFSQVLTTRTLRHVAEEARLDGESLKDAVERYEIDYAWHVLGSQRLLEACVAALGVALGHPANDMQQGRVRELLQAASAAQPADNLMSFDNDVPAHLAALLCAEFAQAPRLLAEPA
ncbi:MAG: hypothetical protein U1E12_12670 [Hydrogenophaga sp.]|uniref:hypothetical protein n=1 Tax=Hydrogenophaga sp. TaxID=1904254 RepID=UPI002ABBB44C|nr:hypothetical protein [Hydrogenophaga sp.]MDZ4102517.1 hypothetical protein [Hydrogenophaga sp.]